MPAAKSTPVQLPLVVATWIGGVESPSLHDDLVDELVSVLAPGWRLFPAAFDVDGVELFVDAASAEEADWIRTVVAEAAAEVPGLAITGDWVFPVG